MLHIIIPDQMQILQGLKFQQIIIIAAFLLQQKGQYTDNILQLILVHVWKMQVIYKDDHFFAIDHSFSSYRLFIQLAFYHEV